MSSFRRFALVLALSLPATSLLLAQSSSSTSGSTAAPQDQQTPAAEKQSNQGALTVQSRIRARREARRAAAIRDVYSHVYEMNLGMGFMRFTPGDNLQRTNFYSWDTGFTRFYNDRLGVTVDGRGNYGTAFVGLNHVTNSAITRPAISMYTVLGGPTYRFYMQPKYSISGRVMAGWAHGHFSGDTNGYSSTSLGLWPDGNTFAINAAIPGEYNLTPAFSLRLSGEDMITGFGSSIQNNFGATMGFVYRFGKKQ
jgi:hypothetical protein